MPESGPWGDTISIMKPSSTIRLLLHNIQGLKRGKKGSQQVVDIKDEVDRLKIDILTLTEINNHFRVLPASEQWKERYYF